MINDWHVVCEPLVLLCLFKSVDVDIFNVSTYWPICRVSWVIKASNSIYMKNVTFGKKS